MQLQQDYHVNFNLKNHLNMKIILSNYSIMTNINLLQFVIQYLRHTNESTAIAKALGKAITNIVEFIALQNFRKIQKYFLGFINLT